jgi:hypothetical protein
MFPQGYFLDRRRSGLTRFEAVKDVPNLVQQDSRLQFGVVVGDPAIRNSAGLVFSEAR